MFNAEYLKIQPINLIRKYYEQVLSTPPREIRAYQDDKKYALLVCFCYFIGSKITDDSLEMLVRLVHKIQKQSKKRVIKDFWHNRRVIYNRDGILRDVAVVSIKYPKGIIEERIYPRVGKEVLENIASAPKSFDEYYNQNQYLHMRSSYVKHYRGMLAPVLDTLTFCSSNENNSEILKAIDLIKKYINKGVLYYPEEEEVPHRKVIAKKYYNLVVDENNNRTQRINYELAVLLSLKNRLKCRDIWIKGARKFRNPDEDTPLDFEGNEERYYNELNLPLDVEEFIKSLKEELEFWLLSLNNNIIKNKKVKIIKKRGKPWVKVTPVERQPDPDNIELLKHAISFKWSFVGLLDILKEVELRIDLTSVFENSASREAMNRQELQYKIVLIIFALATNTGLKRISANIPGISYDDLRYVQKRFISVGNLRCAIRKLINENLKIRDKGLWGNASVSCVSDATQFGSWDQNLISEWHMKYKSQGVMAYWHVDKKSLCVYSQLKTCSSSEIAAMLKGVIYHDTDANIKRNFVDTGGQSLIGFAFSRLLGFELLVRFKGIGGEKLHVSDIEIAKKYNNIAEILTRAINWDLIKSLYNQMIKNAVALKLKTVDPEILLKRFSSNEIKHPVYLALQELGRIIKTIFICKYYCDESLRQEIIDSSNVVERWNGINGFIFYGKKGVIPSNNETMQEAVILCLHLVQASLVYINTLMIQKILQLHEWRNRLTVRDKKALTPLVHEHINPYGVFELDMSKRIEI